MRPVVPVLFASLLLAAACGSEATSSSVESSTTSEAGPQPSAAPTVPATTAPAPSTTVATVPGDEWVRVTAGDAGLEPGAIDRARTIATEAESDCLVVVHDGRLVHEEYWGAATADSDQEIFSATKSVSGVLVGIADDLGLLDIDDPASTHLTEWQGTPSEDVTIRSLLTNTSGRYWDFTTDYVDMTGADDRSGFAIALDQQHEPDTVWVYNNAAIQTLEEVLERATGQDVEAFANEYLFGPTGMDVTFGRDPAGNPATYFSLQAGCLDMARFGLLALEGGQWGGDQVVSSTFMDAATSPSTDLNAAYGYLWWLNAEDGWVHPDPRRDTSAAFWPDAPADAFAALGLGNQVVAVLPSQDLVVVRLGGRSAAGADGPAGALINDLAAAFVS